MKMTDRDDLARACTCDLGGSGPDIDCPQHGMCAGEGHPCHCVAETARPRPDGDLRERVAEAVQSVTLSTAEGCDCDLPPEYDGHTPADAAGRLRALLAEDDTEAHG